MYPDRTYGSARTDCPTGAVLVSVEPGGPADRVGLTPGEVISTANGRPLRDIIDWRWESDGFSVEVEVSSDGATRRLVLERDPEEGWGLDFCDVVFDGVRTCRNRCAFCFMTQLPAGLRPALYVRDDDYRLSFLHGNFVTLTNLDDTDVDRIVDQRLTPLYVSLHAVNPHVREHLVCAREDRALETADELLAAGIELHVQIVLVPGVNDGAELEATLTWLAAREGVRSVGVVPLGYTRHQTRFSYSYESASASAAVLDQLAPWQTAFTKRDGMTWVHAADEFYLNAQRAIPPAEAYDAFPQYENGIGLVRDFTDEFQSIVRARPRDAAPTSSGPDTTVVTGSLFAPVLNGLLRETSLQRRVDVLPIRNDFFGGNVSVTGLLTGADITRAVSSHTAHARYLVPAVIFNEDGLTLDGRTAREISELSGRDVRYLPSDAESLLSAIL